MKLYVINKNEPHILDRVIDSLYNSGVYDLTVVEEELEDYDSESEDSSTDMTKSTLELILEEVDKVCEDPKRVKNLVQEIYMESLKS